MRGGGQSRRAGGQSRRARLIAALAIALCALAPALASARPGRIHTVAGDGDTVYDGDGGPATDAGLQLPSEAAPLPGGGFLIADKKHAVVRRVSRRGKITTVAGTGTPGYNGDHRQATTAQLALPTGVAPLSHGAFLIADSNNSRVRKVNKHGIITTVAGTGAFGYNGDHRNATTAELNFPARVAPIGGGAFLIADFYNNRVREVTRRGKIKTIAGDGTPGGGGDGGPAKQAQLYGPSTALPTADGGVLIDEFGDFGMAAANNSRIRKVNRHGIIHTVAGTGVDGFSGDGGKAKHAKLDHPTSAVPTLDGGFLIADYNNNRIRKVSPSGIIRTVAGTGTPGFSGEGGRARQAEIDHPADATPTPDGGFLIADFFNNRIRKVSGFSAPKACGDGLNVIAGTKKGDHLAGTRRGDAILGRAGNDHLSGKGGGDCVVGGPGHDVLKCGKGHDIAIADAKDTVAGDCEKVK